jgi:PPM family protein phosphatase
MRNVCAACGEVNEPGTAICVRCGAPLGDAAAPRLTQTATLERPDADHAAPEDMAPDPPVEPGGLDGLAPEPAPHTATPGPQAAPAPVPQAAPEELSPLPPGALLGGRFVVEALAQHSARLNIYRARARGRQRCPTCGGLAPDGAQTCPRCGGALTGQAPAEAYLVAEALDPAIVAPDPAVVARPLSHPHLLPVLETFDYTPFPPERHYSVVETRPGLPLSRLTLPQPIERVLGWGAQIADALGYLHQQGLISPGATSGNLLIDGEDATLANLQRARPAPEDPDARAAAVAADVTQLARTLQEALMAGSAPVAGSGRLTPAPAPSAVEHAFTRALRPAPDQPPITAEAWAALLTAAREPFTKPATGIRLRSGRLSNVGRRRPLNEDSLAIVECEMARESVSLGLGIYLVADGMGGHAGGEVASALASAAVIRRLTADFIAPLLAPGAAEPSADETRAALSAAVQDANRRIHEERAGRKSDMGTTLVLAIVIGPRIFVGNVGDSRAYLLRPGSGEDGLQQLTVDHSLVQRLVSMGQITDEQARSHPYRNMIYKSLGEHATVEMDTFVERAPPGSRLLLCSDGLSGLVPDAQLRDLLAAHEDPQAACAALVAAANAAGGTDNITAVAVYIETG